MALKINETSKGKFHPSPMKFVMAEDRYVDKNYDYPLGDGRYAYIGIPIKTNKSGVIGVVRTKDITWHSKGWVMEYLTKGSKGSLDLPDASYYTLAYTTYKANSETRYLATNQDAVVVVYDRDALLAKKAKGTPTAGSGEPVQIIPMASMAAADKTALWTIYEHHLKAQGLYKEGINPLEDVSFIPELHNWCPDQLQEIDQSLKSPYKGIELSTVTQSRVNEAVVAASHGEKRKTSAELLADVTDEEEPVWIATAIPYRPTAAEAEVMHKPGYTRIGYTALMLPPEQIVYTREQPLETKQLLRANGSLKKGYGHSSKEFQFQLHMTDPGSINGVLLPIIRQFQRTPFVPVVNELLNDTYDVQALTLEAVQIATVPGFPNELDVVLQASEFNWRAYMPGEDTFDNTICYPLFKMWCENKNTTYTRPIGWRSDYDGGQTSSVMNGEMKFYLPKEEYLRKMEDIAKHKQDAGDSFVLMRADADRIRDAKKFAAGDSDVRNTYGAHKASETIGRNLVVYDHLRVPVGGYPVPNENLRSIDIVPDASGSKQRYAINDKAVVLRLQNRQLAQDLISSIKDSMDDSGYNEVPTTAYDIYTGRPYKTTEKVANGINPFRAGFIVVPENDSTVVSQASTGSKSFYDIKGRILTPNELGVLLNDKVAAAVHGQGGEAGKSLDDFLESSYFIIPTSNTALLDRLTRIYDQQEIVEQARAQKEEEESMPAASLDTDERLIAQKKWDEIQFQNFVIEQITVGGENLVASLMPQMQDTPVQQFLGKADCHVVVRGTMTDQADVDSLRHMLEQEEYLTRRYSGLHLSNPYSGYMLMKNEICQLMGITHVLPIKCEITTSKDFPGKFDVELIFTQFNPMTQRREELQALTDDVDQDITVNDLQSRSDSYEDKMIRAEHFHKRLRTMELYPDMYLPTFGTLDKWISCLKGSSEQLNSMLAELGINKSSFPWTSEHCRRLEDVPVEKTGDKTTTARAFVDPDFYCAPTFPTGKDFVNGVLGTLGAKAGCKENWMTQDELKPEEMYLQDRLGVTGRLPFYGDVTELGGKYEKLKSKYESILLPNINPKTGKKDGYERKSIESLKKQLEAIGFTPQQIIYIENYADGLGVPRPVAYFLFATEGGAVKQLDGATPDAKKAYGCGQMTADTVTSLNAVMGSQRSLAEKCPWGKNYRFSRQDRAVPQKAIWMSLANYWYKYDRIVDAERKYGRKPNANQCWALAQYAYVWPAMIREISSTNSVTAMLGNLPLVIPPDAKHPNPIRSRVQDALAVLDASASDIYETVKQSELKGKYAADLLSKLQKNQPSSPLADVLSDNIPQYTVPSFASAPSNDINNLLGLVDTTTHVGTKTDSKSTKQTATKKRTTTVDGSANYFFIRAERGVKDDSPLFAMNVFSPEIQRTSGWMNNNPNITFKQRLTGGWRERKLYWRSGHPGMNTSTRISVDSLNHFVDPKEPGVHYYLVKPDTEVKKNKSDYNDWLGYMKQQSLSLADVLYLSGGDPNGKNLWNAEYKSNARHEVIDGVVYCTNIPMDAAEDAGGPTTYKIKDMFIREDGKDMFYDMRNYSGFGRLLQAFPSYCLLLVDGGRWLRFYRLYDHLYGMSAMESIEVFKSRKTPTDVAAVTFSNMYGHLTKQSAESKQGRKFTWSLPMIVGAIQDSVVGSFDKDDLLRWRMHKNSLLLKPGARMHIRMGYGSNPNKLPVLFNGVISEVTPGGDSVQVVGLGDGVELEKKLQPNDQIDGKTVYKAHSLFGSATSPREIMLSVLAPVKFIELVTCGGYDANNPHGIISFGSPTYHFMRKEVNEVGMNIYDASHKAMYEDAADTNSNAWQRAVSGLNLVPGYGVINGSDTNFMFGVSIEDAAAWDVFTTCRRAVPEYICAVHPFGLRSTIFYGKPHWPLRYDYRPAVVAKSTKGATGETFFTSKITTDEDGYVTVDGWSRNEEWPLDQITHWKPFSQVHVIASTYNLISNQIKASSEDVYTICQAVGSHNGVFAPDGLNNDWSSKVFLDTDIYPEHQKTLYVRSGLYSTGIQKLSDAAVNLKPSELLFTRKVSDTAAVNALKDSVADMYQGHCVIVGDPAIKPHDRCFFADTRSEMNGLFPVKEVTHHLSFATGLVSTVSPDMLASVTEFADQMCWSWQGQFGHRFTGALGAQYMIGTVAAKKVNPIFVLKKLDNRLRDIVNKSDEVRELQEATASLLNDIRSAAAKAIDTVSDEMLDHPEYRNAMDKIAKDYADQIEELGKLIEKKSGFLGNLVKPLGKKLTDLRAAWKIEQDAAKIGSGLRYALKADSYAQAAAELKYAYKDLDIVKLLGKRGGIATTAARVGKLTVYTIAVDCLAEWVNRKLAYRQALVLRPLLINGKEFTAGINGHLGCVAGDPDGFWDGVIQSMTNWDYRNKSHDRGNLYNFNSDKDSRVAFGDIAFGLTNLVSWAAGIDPAHYSNLSEEDMDTYILGGTSIPDEDWDKYIDDRVKAFNSLSDRIGSGVVVGSDDFVMGYDREIGSGSGFSRTLKEPHSGDYDANHCNWYAWDVLKANGWNAPPREPGKNTGDGTEGIRINDLPHYPKYYTKYLQGDDARNINNIKPGMLLRLSPQHWAVVTENMTLNENLEGKIQTDRPVSKVISRVEWAIMPKYE